MWRWLLLLVLALSGGCGLDARALTYPGASVYQPSSKDFHFHYLAPPWLADATPKDALIQLSIAATSQAPGTIGSSHQLRVAHADGSSAWSAAQTQRQAALQAGATLSRDVEALTTLTGESGWDVQAYRDLAPGRAFYRDAFFTAATGQLVRFSLLSAYPTDELEIDDLLLSFSAGPDPGTPGPEKVQ
jgi:hypothetical protein